MSGFRLRVGAAADAPAIARLLRDTLTRSLPFLPVLHTAEEDLAFISGHVLPTCTVWVAERDRIVGFIALRPGWIDHLCVDADNQGRGVGSALVAKAFASGPELQLWAFQRNTDALRFYEARGFRIVTLTDGSANEEKEPDARLVWRGPN